MPKKNERRAYNIDFFKKTSHELAYFLGFLITDGCVGKNNNTIRITLKQSDGYILKYFSKIICYKNYVKNFSKFNTYTNKLYYYSSIDINNKTIRNIIINKYGIIPQKTGKEKIPKMPKKYLYSFLLGVLDGDGWVYQKHTQLTSGICCSNIDFLYEIKNIITIGRIRKVGTIYSINFNTDESIILRDLLYKNHNISLKRKRDTFFNYDHTNRSHIRIRNNELDYIIKNATTKKYKDIGKFLKRNEEVVANKARSLGIIKKYSKTFSQKEMDYIRLNFKPLSPAKSINYISKSLNRSIDSIERKIDRMGLRNMLKNFTDYEIKFIYNNMDIMYYSEIAKRLNRTESSIKNKVFRIRNKLCH